MAVDAEAWQAYVESVDSTPQAGQVVKAVVTCFEKANIRDPSSALGLDLDDVACHLEDNEDKAPCKALIRRTLRTLEHSANVQEAAEVSAASQPPAQAPTQVALTQPPVGASAIALANGLTNANVNKFVADVNASLIKAGMEKVPSESRPEAALFQELEEASKKGTELQKKGLYLRRPHRALTSAALP